MHNELIAALDLGSSGVVLALGSRGEEGKVSLLDVTRLSMRGVTRGEITNRAQVSEAVRRIVAEAEQKLGMRIGELYTGTSGRHVRCADHTYHVFVGQRSDGEIRSQDVEALHDGMNNVQAEDGLRILDRVPQRYVVDGRDVVKDPVGRFGKKLEATFGFVLGSSTLLDRMEKTLLALGVRSRKTFASAIASAEAVILPEEREMGVAVVDLGAGATDVCVWYDNAIRYVRSIPFGAGDIDSDIHQQGILEKHVEDLKITYGLAMVEQVASDKLIRLPGRSPRESQEISQRNLATIIEHRLREIIGFVGEEIADSGYGDVLRGGIVLTGGGSQLAGVDELFREMLGLEVRLALPDVQVSPETLMFAQDPANATVIGLLIRALQEDSSGGVQRDSRAVVVGGGAGTSGSGAGDAVGGDEEDEDTPRRGKKKRGGGLRSWFDGFFSETLDGDEDL